MYFIVPYPWLPASVLMGSSCQLNALVQWWALFSWIGESESHRRRRGWGGGLCGCTWQRRGEMWYSRVAVMLSAGNTARPSPFVGGREGARETEQTFTVRTRFPNIIMENNNNHSLVSRTNHWIGPTEGMSCSSCWGRSFERLLNHHGRGATAFWGWDD